MKKLMIAAFSAAAVASAAFAEDAAVAKDEDEGKAAQEAVEANEEEKDECPFEASFSVDAFTAYVDRNMIANDRPVVQPCVSADWTFKDPFYLGFFIWQNYDLTNRRRENLRGGLTETDYEAHVGGTVWQDDDEAVKLNVEWGLEWDVNQRVRREFRSDYHTEGITRLKLELENACVTPYAQAAYMFNPCDGMHYELGLKRDFELCESLTLGLDWNMSFGSARFLEYLYGVGKGYYHVEDEEGNSDEGFARGLNGGVGGTTLKAALAWEVCDHVTIGATVGYTALLNHTMNDSFMDADGWGWDGSDYCRSLVWGGLQAVIGF